MPAAPPARRSWASPAVLAAVVVAVVAAAGWLAARLTVPTIAPDDARPIAEAFLAELRTGKADRMDAAWDGTTAEFKSYKGREQFRRYVKAEKRFAEPAEFLGSEMADRNGFRVADCRFQARSGPVRVFLAREAGAWRVERVLTD